MPESAARFLLHTRRTRRGVLRLSLIAGGLALAGCSGGRAPDSRSDGLVAWPARNRWPAQLTMAPTEVQEAYRYAVANRDVLQYMPCFCGCGAQGHISNFDCYVREMRPDGSVLLDPMSFG